MKKTGSQIERIMYRLLKESGIPTKLDGSIYRDGTRPSNSKKEDTVVIFITALDGETQKGVISINSYVPDIAFNDFFLKDSKRCEEVETALQEFVDSLPTNEFLFSLSQMINTFEEKDINQHFVNVKLNFMYNTLN